MTAPDFAEVTRILIAEHFAAVHSTSGGYTWFCSCGRRGETGALYPSELQAAARRDRHLRAARDRITERLSQTP